MQQVRTGGFARQDGKSGKSNNKVKRKGNARPAKEAEDSASNILVTVRVRPFPAKYKGAPPVVRVIEGKVVVVLDPAEDEEDYLRINRTREKQYAFDTVFDTGSTTQEVFDATCSHLVSTVLDGVNATIFAYGPTGAGKTHTMTGSADEPGVMVLALEQMYRTIQENQDTTNYKVSLSYIEVYNEQIRDLITPQKGVLDLREDPLRGVLVAGVTEHVTNSPSEVMELLTRGNKNRVTESTGANATSSRSHAVLQITVEQRDKVSNTSHEVRIGKLSLIDLAGSERATVTDNRGIRMMEGSNINRSLLALANCINALGSKSRKGSYVPYRDSKLTRLLKDSLGGNCKTSMITNIHSAAESFEETTNTLKYASRAKKIQMVVNANINNVEFHISEYQKIINSLREEVFELKRQLTDTELEPGAVDQNSTKAAPPSNKPKLAAPTSATPEEEHGTGPLDLGACTLRTSEAVRALENGGSLTPESGKRVLQRWKVERENSELELKEMRKLKEQITSSFQERIQLRRMLVEIEDKNMQNKADVDWREAQITNYERCRSRSDEEEQGSQAAVEEPSSIRNLRREVDVYKSNTMENMALKTELMNRLKELSIEGQERWTNIGQRVTRAERRELLELVVQTHTLELENMELELQLRLKDKMIADLQREMDQMRNTMRRHGILDDDGTESGTGGESRPLSERSHHHDPVEGADTVEIGEELPLPSVAEEAVLSEDTL